jgi:hypothetical protein
MIDQIEDEGGGGGAVRDARLPDQHASQTGGIEQPVPDDAVSDHVPAPSSQKELRDTVAGCRERAAEDLSRAAETKTENGRRMLERSAANWAQRADELDQLGTGSADQRAADKALWDDEE